MCKEEKRLLKEEQVDSAKATEQDPQLALRLYSELCLGFVQAHCKLH